MTDVSIIITNYNYGKFLDRCLRSCLKQKHSNYEIILVDDASSDSTDEIIKPFLDDIVFIQHNQNLGVAAAANTGINAAKGRFVIRVDADDYVNEYFCFFLETYLKSNRDAFCVSCDYVLVDNMENKLERKYAEKENISCGIMYRKNLLIKLGGYNTLMRHREEEELRKRLGAEYKIHHLRMPLYRYRMHDHNKTKTKDYKELKI